MQEPYCLAMVLCDAVHKDPATGKSTLLGTFSTFGSATYPAPLAMSIYFSLTDGQGDHQISVRLINSKHIVDDQVESVFEANILMPFPNPIAVIEGSLAGKFLIPEPGVYHCEILCGDITLMSRRVIADQFPMQQGDLNEPTN